ncbi:MAG: isoprenyl transferase [Salinivirgaceae bacterium]|jgi:undecaprenyl diphosphate synthase|nr:isoprenyl transferase [Salinivirgaceae bacterium]MDY0279590.1 isoprenyl transferase [Salinivirgaceae bacterium]
MISKEQILENIIPKHVAIIMDGNGRWAKKKGNSRIFGHKNGVKAVRDAVEAAAELGVSYLTLYAFSTENWNRPKAEVQALMALLVQAIHNEVDNLNKNNIKLLVIGDTASLPNDVNSNLNLAMEKTAKNTGLKLVLALSYSSRWEVIKAVKSIASDIKTNKITPNDIDESLFQQYLETSNMPDPELLIRTSGELRLSNFLLYQMAYSELYFTEKLWPDFRKEDFYNAIYDFQHRERRFGKISEQLNNDN